MKIAVFGGTFDPVHIGHVHAVVEAKISLDLDRIIFVPARQSPLKKTPPAGDAHRLEMLHRATDAYEFMEVDTFELEQEGVSYTHDTASYLSKKYPEDELYFLMGVDQYLDFDKWHNNDELLRLMSFAVMARASEEVTVKAPFIRVQQPVVEVSATIIRERIAEGEIVRHQLNDTVHDYIKEQRLYEA
ncbi:MAG TPA: nicotinate (nicotinamide) nucleotide adenylyltransferase [Candidatus Salinicoccus stercoripullorum]|uniref:Probable nicotinate-nucleotide adenylyltransferase n=1 Tax=Candidatus Salinicoccus stercoripullorum TaxID=2838756 RepID=A0A9D1QHV3_9STAP|nr:nicotinate (nicotinamide) nucleotide adenylyltransferase [Candidatus Salinicoccus stercoripullorum]